MTLRKDISSRDILCQSFYPDNYAGVSQSSKGLLNEHNYDAGRRRGNTGRDGYSEFIYYFRKSECSAHFDKFILKSELKFITLNQPFEKPLLP